MRLNRIRHLPVVDHDGRLIGLVTHRDVLAASSSSLMVPAEEERVRLLDLARAADVMETHVSIALPVDPAADAGERMIRHKIGCLPVVETSGRLAGIVTEEDFLRWATARMAPPEPARASA
jgi:CBS domain-containing membrane protein